MLFSIRFLGIAAIAMAGMVHSANAAVLTFNSPNVAGNAATRTNWLAAVGVATPQHLVDFEAGFTLNQNISGVSGLFPDGLVIRDTSNAGTVRVLGPGSFGLANPVGQFGAAQNELPFLELDFTATPVDYVGFMDIDHGGVQGILTFVGGSTVNFTLDSAAGGGGNRNIAEFVGFFKNDQPRITRVQLDATGDGIWGVDNIEYGRLPLSTVPEPASLGMMTLGGMLLGLWSRRRSK